MVSLLGKQLPSPNMDYPVWRAIHKLTVQTAVEIALHDGKGGILAVPRTDHDWKGYHLPGGYIHVAERVEQACGRIAQVELGINSLKIDKFLTMFAWTNGHPYGHPLSLVFLCSSDQQPNMGEFFNYIPSPMVKNHDLFFARALEEVTLREKPWAILQPPY